MKIDMHVHTCYSADSNLQLDDIIQAVEERRLDGIAVTDHNDIQGALRLKQLAPFPVIVGEEIMTDDGEIIGYFLDEKIDPGLPLLDTIAQIKKQGGLVAVPHPFDRLRSSALKHNNLEIIADHLDLVEVFNSRNVFKQDNQLAKEFAEKAGLVKIAGSDAHTKPEIGAAWIEIETFNGASDFLNKAQYAAIIGKKSSIMVHVETKTKKIMRRFRRG
jgi:predicted metal-dependent phosphoesterase TrpH